jgi:branched-chain amino acid transport system permease protein
MRQIVKRELPLFMFAVIGILIPILIHNQYVLHILILIYILAILGMSWDLIAGYGGIFSFGHQAFYAIGAYIASILSVRYGVSPWLGLIFGGVFATATSFVIAYPVLRLRGPYIALVTLSFSLIVYQLLIVMREITGGPSGLWGIPTFPAIRLGPIEIVISYVDRTNFYYMTLTLTLITILALRLYVSSRYGLYLRVIKEQEEVAETIGINTTMCKLLTFLISVFFAGTAGAFYGYYIQLISPVLTWVDTMLDIVLATILGGFGTIYGALVGSALVLFLKEYLRTLGHLRLVIFGGLLLLIIIFFPKGLTFEIIKRLGKTRKT